MTTWLPEAEYRARRRALHVARRVFGPRGTQETADALYTLRTSPCEKSDFDALEAERDAELEAERAALDIERAMTAPTRDVGELWDLIAEVKANGGEVSPEILARVIRCELMASAGYLATEPRDVTDRLGAMVRQAERRGRVQGAADERARLLWDEGGREDELELRREVKRLSRAPCTPL